MGITERHWFENEEPELTERQLEDIVNMQDRIYKQGYDKGYSDGVKEQKEPKQIIRKQCKTEHSDGSVDYFAEWYCPHCNMLILRGFDNPSIKYCYKCGGPIVWKGL